MSHRFGARDESFAPVAHMFRAREGEPGGYTALCMATERREARHDAPRCPDCDAVFRQAVKLQRMFPGAEVHWTQDSFEKGRKK